MAIASARVLQSRPSLVSWGVACILVAIVAGVVYAANFFGEGSFTESRYSVVAGCAVFIAAPMLATFGVERVWFRLGSAVSRRFTTLLLSLPLGVLTFVFSLFVALVIAVNIGLLEP